MKLGEIKGTRVKTTAGSLPGVCVALDSSALSPALRFVEAEGVAFGMQSGPVCLQDLREGYEGSYVRSVSEIIMSSISNDFVLPIGVLYRYWVFLTGV